MRPCNVYTKETKYLLNFWLLAVAGGRTRERAAYNGLPTSTSRGAAGVDSRRRATAAVPLRRLVLMKGALGRVKQGGNDEDDDGRVWI